MRRVEVVSEILTRSAVPPIGAGAVGSLNMMVMVSVKIWLA